METRVVMIPSPRVQVPCHAQSGLQEPLDSSLGYSLSLLCLIGSVRVGEEVVHTIFQRFVDKRTLNEEYAREMKKREIILSD